MQRLPWYVRLKPEFRERHDAALTRYGGPDRWYGAIVITVPGSAPVVSLSLFALADLMPVPVVIEPPSSFDYCANPQYTRNDNMAVWMFGDEVLDLVMNGTFGWSPLTGEPADRFTVRSVNPSATDNVSMSGALFGGGETIPINFLVLESGHEPALTHIDHVMDFIPIAALAGRSVRITKFVGCLPNNLGLPERTAAWMREIGHVEFVINGVRSESGVSMIRFNRQWIRPSSIEFTIVPEVDEIRPGDLVVFRRTGLESSMGFMPYHTPRLVNRVLDANSLNLNICPLNTDGGPGAVCRHEVRRLSEEELTFVRTSQKVEPFKTSEIEEALGPILLDVIRQYPTASATKGLVFARTDTALLDEDDNYEKIVAKLCHTPGKLAAIRSLPELYLPKDMVARGHDLVSGPVVVGAPPANPLDALDDDDMIEVEVRAVVFQERSMKQYRTVTHEGSVSIPVCVVREGRAAVQEWLIEQEELPMSDEDDREWEDDGPRDNRNQPPEFERLEFGEFDNFVPKRSTADNAF